MSFLEEVLCCCKTIGLRSGSKFRSLKHLRDKYDRARNASQLSRGTQPVPSCRPDCEPHWRHESLAFRRDFECRTQSGVLTQLNDISRNGQNTDETILTTLNANVNQFGKLFALSVDGQVYAQPLYVPNVAIAGGSHNVLIVATEADSVCAFDADSNTGANASPFWKASLVDAAHGSGAGETPLNSSTTIGCTDLQPQIGITSTPTIEPSSNTIYVEAKSTNGTFDTRMSRPPNWVIRF